MSRRTRGRADAGFDPCVGLLYCLRGFTPSVVVIKVRETAAVTVVVDNPMGLTLQYSVEPTMIRARRPAGRPALVMADVQLEATISQNGVLSFRVLDVPPWFFTTGFEVPVRVKGPSSGDVELTAFAEVKVVGNTVFASGTEGTIYAVASDGRPATRDGSYPTGQLIEQLVEDTRAILLLKDGSLLVYEDGVSPKRLLKFGLTGPDALLDTFDFRDVNQDPLIKSGAVIPYNIAELPDGRIVVTEYQFAGISGTPKSRLLVWKADGTFDRAVSAPGPDEQWRAVTYGPNDEVLVADRDLMKIVRYDPSTWLPAGDFLDTLPSAPHGLMATPEGDVYVGGSGYALQVRGGGRMAIVDLPSSSIAWRNFAPYGAGRVVAANDVQTASGNIAIFDDARFDGYLRPMNAGGRVTAVWGVAFLE